MGAVGIIPHNQYRNTVRKADNHVATMAVETAENALLAIAGSIDHANAIRGKGNQGLTKISHHTDLLGSSAFVGVRVTAHQLVAVKDAYLLRQTMQMEAAQPEPSADGEQHHQQ